MVLDRLRLVVEVEVETVGKFVHSFIVIIEVWLVGFVNIQYHLLRKICEEILV